MERKGGGNGNYVLKCLCDKKKGKINKSSLRGMSSGTLTYPMATPVNLSMALTMKMKQRKLLKAQYLMMFLVRFLFVHQWTLMTILCQILQNLLHCHMFIHHLCLPSHCMFIHHPSCFLVIHQAVKFLLHIQIKPCQLHRY